MDTREIRELSVYDLANMVQCGAPDSKESEGALLLASIRDAVADAIDGGYVTRTDRNDGGQLHEIADNGPSVYTHARWLQFVDLAAYAEEPERGEWTGSLTEIAAQALYQVCERLAGQIVDDWAESWECSVCGDMGADSPCEADVCFYDDQDEDAADDMPAAPVQGNAEASEVSDPLLTLIEEVEAARMTPGPVVDPFPTVTMPGDETSAFMARMDAINATEFERRRRWPWGWLRRS